MSAFGVRSRGYQAGLILLFISTTLFIIGLVSPMWLVYEREIRDIRQDRFYAGVMVGCRYIRRMVGATSFDYTRCGFGFSYAFEYMSDMGDWVHAVEAFEIISAAALIFACIYGATINCFTIYPSSRTRILEITTGVAGGVAFIFCMVFVGQLRSGVEKNVFYTFSWAFYLTVVATIATVIAAIIIALFNEYIPPPSDFRFSNASLAKPSVNYATHTDTDELYDPRISQSDLASEVGSRGGPVRGYSGDNSAGSSGGRRGRMSQGRGWGGSNGGGDWGHAGHESDL